MQQFGDLLTEYHEWLAVERGLAANSLQAYRRDLRRYAGYLERESEAVERLKASDALLIPPDVDFAAVPQLRFEARQKFDRVRPRTVGQAGRISGISPADLTVLMIHLARRRRDAVEAEPAGAQSPG